MRVESAERQQSLLEADVAFQLKWVVCALRKALEVSDLITARRCLHEVVVQGGPTLALRELQQSFARSNLALHELAGIFIVTSSVETVFERSSVCHPVYKTFSNDLIAHFVSVASLWRSRLEPPSPTFIFDDVLSVWKTCISSRDSEPLCNLLSSLHRRISAAGISTDVEHILLVLLLEYGITQNRRKTGDSARVDDRRKGGYDSSLEKLFQLFREQAKHNRDEAALMLQRVASRLLCFGVTGAEALWLLEREAGGILLGTKGRALSFDTDTLSGSLAAVFSPRNLREGASVLRTLAESVPLLLPVVITLLGETRFGQAIVSECIDDLWKAIHSLPAAWSTFDGQFRRVAVATLCETKVCRSVDIGPLTLSEDTIGSGSALRRCLRSGLLQRMAEKFQTVMAILSDSTHGSTVAHREHAKEHLKDSDFLFVAVVAASVLSKNFFDAANGFSSSMDRGKHAISGVFDVILSVLFHVLRIEDAELREQILPLLFNRDNRHEDRTVVEHIFAEHILNALKPFCRSEGLNAWSEINSRLEVSRMLMADAVDQQLHLALGSLFDLSVKSVCFAPLDQLTLLFESLSKHNRWTEGTLLTLKNLERSLPKNLEEQNYVMNSPLIDTPASRRALSEISASAVALQSILETEEPVMVEQFLERLLHAFEVGTDSKVKAFAYFRDWAVDLSQSIKELGIINIKIVEGGKLKSKHRLLIDIANGLSSQHGEELSMSLVRLLKHISRILDASLWPTIAYGFATKMLGNLSEVLLEPLCHERPELLALIYQELVEDDRAQITGYLSQLSEDSMARRYIETFASTRRGTSFTREKSGWIGDSRASRGASLSIERHSFYGDPTVDNLERLISNGEFETAILLCEDYRASARMHIVGEVLRISQLRSTDRGHLTELWSSLSLKISEACPTGFDKILVVQFLLDNVIAGKDSFESCCLVMEAGLDSKYCNEECSHSDSDLRLYMMRVHRGLVGLCGLTSLWQSTVIRFYTQRHAYRREKSILSLIRLLTGGGSVTDVERARRRPSGPWSLALHLHLVMETLLMSVELPSARRLSHFVEAESRETVVSMYARKAVSFEGSQEVRKLLIDRRTKNDRSRSSEANLPPKQDASSGMFILTGDSNHDSNVRRRQFFPAAPNIALAKQILDLLDDTPKKITIVLDIVDGLPSVMSMTPATTLQISSQSLHMAMESTQERSMLSQKQLLEYAKQRCLVGYLNSSLAAEIDERMQYLDFVVSCRLSGYKGVFDLRDIRNPATARRLRDDLIAEDLMTLALELSQKARIESDPVWYTWGMNCLAARDFLGAREKFKRCLVPIRAMGKSLAGRGAPPPFSVRQIVERIEALSPPPQDAAMNRLARLQKLKTLPRRRADVSLSVDSYVGLIESNKDEAVAVSSSPMKTRRISQSSAEDSDRQNISDEKVEECTYYLSVYGTQTELISFFTRHGLLDRAVDLLASTPVSLSVVADVVSKAAEYGCVEKLTKSIVALPPSRVSRRLWRLLSSALSKQRRYEGLYDAQSVLNDSLGMGLTALYLFMDTLSFGQAKTWIERSRRHLQDALLRYQRISLSTKGDLEDEESEEGSGHVEEEITEEQLSKKVQLVALQIDILDLWAGKHVGPLDTLPRIVDADEQEKIPITASVLFHSSSLGYRVSQQLSVDLVDALVAIEKTTDEAGCSAVLKQLKKYLVAEQWDLTALAVVRKLVHWKVETRRKLDKKPFEKLSSKISEPRVRVRYLCALGLKEAASKFATTPDLRALLQDELKSLGSKK